MAFISTNPNPYIINLPAIQNVQTSALGPGATTTATSTYINSNNASLSINSINAYTTTLSYITVNTSLNLAYGYGIYMNGLSFLTSNSINGGTFLAFQVGGTEYARITGGNVGIGTNAPGALLDVNGSAIIRQDLYVNGVHYPSDPSLKTDIRPYTTTELPTAVRFRWKDSGKEDIGVLADDILAKEPLCVGRNKNGTMTVDYPKLVVLCLAEIAALKTRITQLEKSQV